MVFTHRKELLKQAGSSFEKFGLTPEFINAGSKPDLTNPLHVAMVETFDRRKDDLGLFLLQKTLIIIDECFIKGTLIDGVKIENLKIGDYVYSFNHFKNKIESKKILAISKKEINKELIIIKYSNELIVCTHKHPIFVVNKGYINAKDLKNGDRIIMQTLSNKNDQGRYKKLELKSFQFQKAWIYFLFIKMQIITLCKNAFRKNERKQPNVKRRNKIQNVGNIKKNWTQTKNTGWKWKGLYCGSINVIRKTWRWMVSRTYIKNRKRIFTLSLQNRYWKSYRKNSNRNKRKFSLFFNITKKRFEKKNTFRIERIQSVSVLERRNYKQYGICDETNYVYNLEVEHNNNYFANGVLVHNCHINNFTKLFEYISKETIVIGVTATPHRKGANIPSLSDFYTDLVQNVDTQKLIELGFLAKAESFGVKIRMDKLKQKGDDYDTEKYYSEHKMYAGVVENWKRLTPNKKTLLFASNVKSSKEVCQEFILNGIEAKHIDAKTPANIRTETLSWFENTENAILCNCGILVAGYNCPDIETIILYRATTSLPLFLQMVGRGSRITPTKTKFTILDFGNNIHRLGFWEDKRTWSLQKVEQRTNEKEDAGFIKICKKCGAILPPSTKICPYCGSVIKKEEKEVVAELSLLTKREMWSQDLETKALMCKNKLMNGFAVLHSLESKSDAREFIRLMGYNAGFEKTQGYRFKVFRQ